MASVKVKFRPSTIVEREGVVYYQIIHDRKVRQLRTTYRVFPSEWNENRSMVTTTLHSDRKAYILSLRDKIHLDLQRLARIVHRLDDADLIYTADDVVAEFYRYEYDYSLFHFMESIIDTLQHNGRLRTSETYRSALNSFKRFRDNEDIMLDCITSATMEAYEAWNRQRGITQNSMSFYSRILRAVYNRAVDDDIIENRKPFRRVYTGVDKTIKRALPLKVIKKIKALDLSSRPSLDFARDMFMMSFYLRGMSLIDMAYLKKTDLKYGYITYRRHKTGQQLAIAWTKEMQKTLDKYPENRSKYLMPIIRNPGTNERYTYRNIGYNINHGLKRIARMIGIDFRLTLYVARHSWASVAKAQGIPISVISEGMGHNSEATTRIYLASLDTNVIDRANSRIINSLK